MRSSARRCEAGFSLIEVVTAVGIFAVGIVVVLGLFAPVVKSVTGVADAAAAANVAELLKGELTKRAIQSQSFTGVAALLKNSTARSHQLTDADNNPNAVASDPRRDPQLLFASRDGSKIGGYTDSVWGGSDLEKFFEIALIRHEALSPNNAASDASALVLAYVARIRWPAFVPDFTPANPRRALPAGYNPNAALIFDHSQKQVLVIAGSITR